MKGKIYLLITSILIIAGAITGLILFTIYPTPVPRFVEYSACGLFLITGIIGIAERTKRSTVCVILGTILLALAIGSIPAMLVFGKGSASLGLLLSALVSIVVTGLYLLGAKMNKKPRHAKYYRYVR